MATQQPQHTNHDSDLFQDTFPNQRSFLGLMIHINKGLKWVSNIQWTGQKMYYDKHLMMIMGPLVQSREAQHLGFYSSQWTGKYCYERLEDNRQLLEFNYCLWHGCVTYSFGTADLQEQSSQMVRGDIFSRSPCFQQISWITKENQPVKRNKIGIHYTANAKQFPPLKMLN